MRERESQLERDISVDAQPGLDSQSDADRTSTDRNKGRVRSRIESLLSTRALLFAIVLSSAGIIISGAIPFLGIGSELAGVVAAGFLYGLGTETRRYVEMALAGALVGGGATLLGNLFVAIIGSGTTLTAVGLVGGALAGAVGHYFGRDLRHGLTRDLQQ